MGSDKLDELFSKYNLSEDDILALFLRYIDKRIGDIVSGQEYSQSLSRELVDRFSYLIKLLESKDNKVKFLVSLNRLDYNLGLLSKLLEKSGRGIANEVGNHVASQINSKLSDSVVNSLIRSIALYSKISWVFWVIVIFLGLLIFLTGFNFSRFQMMADLSIQNELLRSNDIRRSFEFVQTNPYLLNCSRLSWRVQKINKEKICIPYPDENGKFYGWSIP